MTRAFRIFAATLLCLLVLPALAGRDGAGARAQSSETDWLAAVAALPRDGFPGPEAGRTPALPDDHAPHADSRTESWQVAAHLTAPDGTPVAVQLSLTRVGLVPAGVADDGAWTLREAWRGHAVVSGPGPTGIAAEERIARGVPGATGWDNALDEVRVDHWALRFADDGTVTLTAAADGARATLEMSMRGGPLFADASQAPFAGYSLPRMRVEGKIATEGATVEVTGDAWLDHLWGDLPLPGQGPIAWDRLVLHLDDGSAVTLTRSRRRDGGGVATLDGVIVAPDGTATPIDGGTMDPVRRWRSGDGGGAGDGTAAWPVVWRVSTGTLALEVTAAPDAQAHDFAAPVWAGLVTVTGTRDGEAVAGLGSMQLTGYEGR